MSLIMTLIITYINTGMDSGYFNRFLKAWVVGLPIAIGIGLYGLAYFIVHDVFIHQRFNKI